MSDHGKTDRGARVRAPRLPVSATAAAGVIIIAAGIAAAAEQDNKDKYYPQTRVTAKNISAHIRLHSAAAHGIQIIKFYFSFRTAQIDRRGFEHTGYSPADSVFCRLRYSMLITF